MQIKCIRIDNVKPGNNFASGARIRLFRRVESIQTFQSQNEIRVKSIPVCISLCETSVKQSRQFIKQFQKP